MTGPFEGQSMAQFLGEAAKGRNNTELARAFLGFEMPMKEAAKWLGREVGVKARSNDAMEEEVPEEEASSGEAASLSSEAAAVSGEVAAASRKRLGSDDEPKKTKKLNGSVSGRGREGLNEM